MRIANALPLLTTILAAGLACGQHRPAPAAEAGATGGANKKIVFLPGQGSHGWFAHAHRAGCLLLARCLNENVPGVEAVVSKGGWPKEESMLEGAAAIVIYCDGASVPSGHFEQLDALAKKGAGVVFLHYALDVGKGSNGDHLLDWIGGYYEQHWSINPSWTAEFKKFPDHPVARGVRPFRIHDEWYYHMRFREGMKGVTPILSAVPPESTRDGPDGAHSGNPAVRARQGMAEHLAWAYERPDGGRGFGFTGGHDHQNWAHDDLRKAVLNGIVWTAKLDVPTDGVASKRPTPEELETHQDSPKPKNWKADTTRRLIERFRQP